MKPIDNRRKYIHDVKVLLGFMTGIVVMGFVGQIRVADAKNDMLYPTYDNLPGAAIWTKVQEVEVYKSPETIEQEIRQVFGKDADGMLKVAKCESGMNPKAFNRESSARGLFQIMATVHGIKEKWLFNPSINIRVAKQLFDAQGYEPWRASNHCHRQLQ